MPKILVLSNTPSQSADLADKASASYDVTLASYEDIRATVQTERCEVWIKETPLSHFEGVLFRSIGPYIELQALLSHQCRQLQIPVFDQALADRTWFDSKIIEYSVCAEAHLPIIPSQVLFAHHLQETASLPPFPFIIKRPDSRQGDGVYLCHSSEEVSHIATQYPHQPLIVQPFIPNDSDVRAFVIQNEVVGAIRRIRQDANEFRNNASLGAHTEPFPLDTATTQLATQAARVMGYDVAGVDLMFDTTAQQWVILEINRSPQFKAISSTLGQSMASLMLEKLFPATK